MSPLAILAPRFRPACDGVGDHAAFLAHALAARHRVIVLTGPEAEPPPPGTVAEEGNPAIQRLDGLSRCEGAWVWRAWRAIRGTGARTVLIEYVPFLYARGGISPGLLVLTATLRLGGARVILWVHEPYVPWSCHPKYLVMSLLQRLFLGMLIVLASEVVASIERWKRMAETVAFWKRGRIRRIVSGPTIPCLPLSAADRVRWREKLGIRPDEVVLTHFGQPHVSKRYDLMLATLARARAAGAPARLLMIGLTSTDLLQHLEANRTVVPYVVMTGYVSEAEVSAMLSISDIVLLPFIDGVTTRRSTVAAALEHGLPVVTTRGPLTDRDIAWEEYILLAHVGDQEGFVDATLRLIRDPAARRHFARRSRDLFQERFAWSQIIQEFESLCR